VEGDHLPFGDADGDVQAGCPAGDNVGPGRAVRERADARDRHERWTELSPSLPAASRATALWAPRMSDTGASRGFVPSRERKRSAARLAWSASPRLSPAGVLFTMAPWNGPLVRGMPSRHYTLWALASRPARVTWPVCPAERGDVVPHPPQRRQLVGDAEVALGDPRGAQTAESAEPVVDRDDDHGV
jgi:hypothetical protein